jgi:hypothetical protein
MKTFHVRAQADVVLEYIVEAIDVQDACDQVSHGTAKHYRMYYMEHEIDGAEEITQ